MAELYFKIKSDWEEVVKLRNEISKLKSELYSLDVNKAPQAAKVLEHQINQTSQKMRGMVEDAARAGVEIENSFKKKIFEASHSVNSFTEKIIQQKAVVKDVEADVRKLGEAYRKAKKESPMSASDKLADYKAAKNALHEEKAALFQLTQQKAEAQLAVKKLRDEYSLFGKEVRTTTNGFGISLKKSLAMLGGASALKGFASQVVSVRGQFQAMETSIRTLLSSKEQADTLLAQVKDYATKSPLELKSVSSAAQMMLGFNIEAEKAPRYIQAIGDISMGNAGKFHSLTLAFSQMSATGKLMGQDLNQMINAGFNPLSVISEKTGKSIAQLKEEMSKGAISAQMVQQAFIDATSAGGKFYGMSENASKTIEGQMSKLQDAMDNVFNEIGKSSEDFIMGSIQATSSLVENYQQVGRVLAALIATYGTYRTAVMLNIAIERGWTAAKGLHTLATKAQTVAQLALNAAMKANPYVLLATVVIGLASAMWALRDSTKGAAAEQERLKKRAEEQAESMKAEKEEIDKLLAALQDDTETRNTKHEALERLKQLYPSVFDKYKTEKELLEDITNAQRNLNQARGDGQRALGMKNYQDDVQRYKDLVRLKELHGKWRAGRNHREAHEWSTLFVRYKIREEAAFGESESATIDRMLKSAASTVGAHQSELRKQQSSDFDLKLRGMSLDEAKKELELLNNYRKQLKESGKKWATIQGEEAPLDETELKRRANSLKELINAERKDSAQYRKEAQKEWEAAKKEVEAVKNGKITYTSSSDYEAKLKEAKDKESAAKKRYESLGGETSNSSKSTKNDSLKERAYVSSYEFDKEAKKHAAEIMEIQEQTDSKVRQNAINLLEDGAEKEIEQIRLNYDKKIQEIRKEEARLIELQEAEQYEAWKRENPDYKEKGLQFNPSSTTLPDDLLSNINTLYVQADAERDKQLSDLHAKLLAKYADFNTRRLEIEQEFDGDIKALEDGRTAANSAATDKAIAEVKRKKEETLKALNEEQVESETKDNAFFKRLFGDQARMAYGELEKLREQAEQLRDYLSGRENSESITFISSEQLQRLEQSPERLAAIKKALDDVLGGSRYGDSPLGKAFDQMHKGFDKLKGAKTLGDIAAGVSGIASGAGAASGALGDMFRQMGDDDMADAMEGVQTIVNGISSIADGFAKGGVMGGIFASVGVAADLIGKAFARSAEHAKALKAIRADSLAQERAHTLSLLEQNRLMERASTLFGTDKYAKASAAVNVMRSAVNNLNKEIKGVRPTLDLSFKSIMSGGIAKYYKELAYYQNGVAGLANIEIKTGHRKGNLFRRGKDIYSSILEVYPKLIDAQGKFDSELAKTIISTRAMSDEHKATLQHMIDLAEQEKKSIEEVNNYLTGIFGQLGSSMADSLVDAFRNGTDAAKNFVQSVSKMLEQLGKDMIYSVTLQPVMERAQQQMSDIMNNSSMGSEDKFKGWTRVLRSVVDEAKQQQALANKLMGEYQAEAAKHGLNIFSPEASEQDGGSRGGYETMSQDMGAEINGRLTAVQVSSEGILAQGMTTNEWLSKIYGTLTMSKGVDISSSIRTTLGEGWRPSVSINFPTDKMDKLVSEVNSLRESVSSIERRQAESSIDREAVARHTETLAKQHPKLIQILENIDTNTK